MKLLCNLQRRSATKALRHKENHNISLGVFVSWWRDLVAAVGLALGNGGFRIFSGGGKEIGLALIAEDFISPEPIGGGGIAPKGISEQEGS